jgi:hypothetical protein
MCDLSCDVCGCELKRRVAADINALIVGSHSQKSADRLLPARASYLSAIALTTRVGDGLDPLTPAPRPLGGEGRG